MAFWLDSSSPTPLPTVAHCSPILAWHAYLANNLLAGRPLRSSGGVRTQCMHSALTAPSVAYARTNIQTTARA
jgi:hypothetical protein